MTALVDIRHALDPVSFARERLDFQPDPSQARVLASASKRVILNCARQWGKSALTAAKAAFIAWHQPENLSLVGASPASGFAKQPSSWLVSVLFASFSSMKPRAGMRTRQRRPRLAARQDPAGRMPAICPETLARDRLTMRSASLLTFAF